MANLRLSELIQRAPDGTEFLEVIIPPFTAGTNRKVLLQDLIDLAGDEHFRGAYVSLVALQTAVPVGIVGDYADVDTGIGSDAVRYIWDDDDNAWIAGGSVVPDADGSTKGIAKLYPNLSAENTDGAPDQNSVVDALALKADSKVTIKVKVASHTMDSADLADLLLGKQLIFEMSSGSALNFTVPDNTTLAIPIGSVWGVKRTGAGQVTSVAGGSDPMVLTSTSGLLTDPGIDAIAVYEKVDTNETIIQNGIPSIVNFARVERAAAQTLTTGLITPITWDTETFDNAAIWSGANPTRLTVGGVGNKMVIISGVVAFGINTTGIRRVLLYKNGSLTTSVASITPQASIATSMNFNFCEFCSAGDYFEVHANQSSGGNLDITAHASMEINNL